MRGNTIQRYKVWINLAAFCLVLLTGCGSNIDSTAEESSKEEVIIQPENNWELVIDKVDDFGDGQVIFENKQINSNSNKLSLVVACTGGLFELWTETDFYLPDRVNGAARIKINGGEAETWALDKRADVGNGVFAVRFKNGVKLFQMLSMSKTLSVKLDAGGSTFESATFDLEGISEIPKKLETVGCD